MKDNYLELYKFHKLLALILFLFPAICSLNAQTLGTAATTLSYEITTSTYFQSVDTSSVSNWHIFDKIDSRPSFKVERIEKVADTLGNWQVEKEHVFDSSVKPWRTKVPKTTIINSNGSVILDKFADTLLMVAADSAFQTFFDTVKLSIIENGLYAPPNLNYPNGSNITTLQTAGWTTSTAGGLFTMSKDGMVRILDTLNLTTQTRIFEDDKLQYEILEQYHRLESGILIPMRTTVWETKTFTNGECVTFVAENTYNDYEFSPLEPRSSKHRPQKLLFTISPNPAQSEIHIEANQPEIYERFTIVDSNGRIMKRDHSLQQGFTIRI
ncbi:MAG: hypothetical protein ABIV51_03395 [Saprospiraceae bacterium]